MEILVTFEKTAPYVKDQFHQLYQIKNNFKLTLEISLKSFQKEDIPSKGNTLYLNSLQEPQPIYHSEELLPNRLLLISLLKKLLPRKKNIT